MTRQAISPSRASRTGKPTSRMLSSVRWLRVRSSIGSATITVSTPARVAVTRSREDTPSREPGTVTGCASARSSSSRSRIDVSRSASSDALTTRPRESTTCTISVPVRGSVDGSRPEVTRSATSAAVAVASASTACRLAIDNAA